MKKLYIFLTLLIFSLPIFAQTIASCTDPKGYSYFPNIGLVSKAKSGWDKDGIVGGKFTLNRLAKDEYDILFLDSTRKIKSSAQDGGRVFVIRKNPKEISILVAYESVTLIYNFWKNADGTLQFSELSSKGGDNPIYKSGLVVGNCEFINFQ